MKAAVLVGQRRIEIRETPRPNPGEGEVLVRVRQAGICGTDYALFLGELGGKFPIVPGHEAVGEIAALGPEVKGLGIGDRVTIQPNFPCGKCQLCQEGKGNICLHKERLGLDIDGVFAQYVRVPQRYIWPLPDDLPFSVGVFVEPLSVALHGIGKSSPSRGERVLIYGTGVIGLLFIQLAILAGGWVTAFDIAERRLTLAKELGVKKTIGSIDELEKEAGAFSLIYETSGTAEALARIVRLCAPGGQVVLAGLPEGEFPIPTALIVRKELIIQGSMIYNNEFPEALKLLKKGEIKVQPLISDIYHLEELPRAFEEFHSPRRVKPIILIQ